MSAATAILSWKNIHVNRGAMIEEERFLSTEEVAAWLRFADARRQGPAR
jgi:hypothetical protein